jgi:pilus assembly protein Flp/PilA
LAIGGWDPGVAVEIPRPLVKRRFETAEACERGDPKSGESYMLRVRNFLSDESGVTAIEYALIASLIAVFIIVAVQLVGTQISTVFTEVGNTLI